MRSTMGFNSFLPERIKLAGIEIMHMGKIGQLTDDWESNSSLAADSMHWLLKQTLCCARFLLILVYRIVLKQKSIAVLILT